MEPFKIVCTAFLSAVSLFIIAKFMGHKQLVQLDLFDYINGITIGSIAAELATELEKPMQPLIAMAVYGVISVGLSKLTSKFPKIRKFVNGTPTILMNNGKLYRDNMKKSKLDLSEFLLMCRQEGYFDLSAIQTAIFEHNGKLNILPASTQRPVTPGDMKLAVPPAFLFTELIMDGKIMGENLKRKGLDEVWLTKQLKEQGYRSAKEIFLALCDDSNQVVFYRYQ